MQPAASPYIVYSPDPLSDPQPLYSLQEYAGQPTEYRYRAGSLHSLLYSGLEEGGSNSSNSTTVMSSHNYALTVITAADGGGRKCLDNNNSNAVRCGEFDCGVVGGYGEYPLQQQQQHPPRQSLLVSGIL